MIINGKNNVHTVGQDLSLEQRRWLEELIVAGKETVTSVAGRFNLPAYRLNKYAGKVRTGGILAMGPGRPNIWNE